MTLAVERGGAGPPLEWLVVPAVVLIPLGIVVSSRGVAVVARHGIGTLVQISLSGFVDCRLGWALGHGTFVVVVVAVPVAVVAVGGGVGSEAKVGPVVVICV